jgi:hypothetical protein
MQRLKFPYPFLLMSMSPRDWHKGNTLQLLTNTPQYRRSHVRVRRRITPTGTAAADPRVPGQTCALLRGLEQGVGVTSLTLSQGSAHLQYQAQRSFENAGKNSNLAPEWWFRPGAWSSVRNSEEAPNPDQRGLRAGV